MQPERVTVTTRENGTSLTQSWRAGLRVEEKMAAMDDFLLHHSQHFGQLSADLEKKFLRMKAGLETEEDSDLVEPLSSLSQECQAEFQALRSTILEWEAGHWEFARHSWNGIGDPPSPASRQYGVYMNNDGKTWTYHTLLEADDATSAPSVHQWRDPVSREIVDVNYPPAAGLDMEDDLPCNYVDVDVCMNKIWPEIEQRFRNMSGDQLKHKKSTAINVLSDSTASTPQSAPYQQQLTKLREVVSLRCQARMSDSQWDNHAGLTGDKFTLPQFTLGRLNDFHDDSLTVTVHAVANGPTDTFAWDRTKGQFRIHKPREDFSRALGGPTGASDDDDFSDWSD